MRAIAVVPVLFFHAGFAPFSGGFVGVDVFFVISGYLITSIILPEISAGKFSLASFYERRARRILPALFFIMAACLPLAWLSLLPLDMQEFAQSLVAVATFSSNFLFWLDSGYFATSAELKPLLHTWSLAVEEQYYLLFPLLLLLTWKAGRFWVVFILAGITVISLGVSHWGAYFSPDATFYLLHTRIWEILLGSLVAFYLYQKPARDDSGIVDELCSLLGLACIVFAVFVFNRHTPFPSLYALVPTLGAVLIIIFAGDKTLMGRGLSHGVLVGTGLISYSLYLWHQPLLAFARHQNLKQEPSLPVVSALLVLSFILAYFTWRFVERPMRRRNLLTRNQIAGLSVAVTAVFIGLGLFGINEDGMPKRFDSVTLNLLKVRQDGNPLSADCLSRPQSYIDPAAACVLGKTDNITGVLLGDSHADAIAFPLGQSLARQAKGLMFMGYVGCPPVRGIYRLGTNINFLCTQFNQAAFDAISANRHIEFVVLAARFTLYLEGERFDNGEGGIEPGRNMPVDAVDFRGKERTGLQRRESVAEKYTQSVRTLLDLGKKIILVYPIPEVGWDVPHYARELFLSSGVVQNVSTDYRRFEQRNAATIEALDAVGDHPNLVRIYPHEIFCDSFVRARCAALVDGKALYRDDDHLSDYGASLLVDEIMARID